MTIKQFAHKHRLRVHKDEDYTDIIPGKQGQIYEYDEDLLGVLVMPKSYRRNYWGYTRTGLMAAGCVVVQDGDQEGAAKFDPQDSVQVKTALRAARVKKIRASRPPSPAQLEALREAARTRSRKAGRTSNAGPRPRDEEFVPILKQRS